MYNPLIPCVYEAALTDVEVSSIISFESKFESVDAKIGSNDAGVSDSNVRSTEIKWIPPDTYQGKYITDICYKYVNQANRENYAFDISTISDIQYTIYNSEQSGHYSWHHDVLKPDCSFDRKLSVSIQLSDPKDYEGGNLIFAAGGNIYPTEVMRKRGTVIVFPSFIEHMVEPVTRGTRKSLVTWVEGPKWK